MMMLAMMVGQGINKTTGVFPVEKTNLVQLSLPKSIKMHKNHNEFC